MIFQETNLGGAFVADLDERPDERGFFARAFCAREFNERGIDMRVVQANLSFNEAKGTLRGMHYQVNAAIEPKFVRCIRGSVWDVIIDMRPDSPTYLQHLGMELSAENRRALYVPGMFAHGYLTLTDAAEVLYLTGEFYTPGCERGVRYDDPALGIDWPVPVNLVSEKDKSWPLLEIDT